MAALTFEVKATEIEEVKGIFQLLIDITKDERIPTNIRKEWMDKANEIMEHPPDMK